MSRHSLEPQYDVSFADHPRCKLDVFPARPDAPVIIFWHGGSWMTGDKSAYRFMAKRLNALGFTVALPNYRLHPEVVFPEFVVDGAKAVRWVHENLASPRVILMGHSAGAYIAAVLALDSSYLRAVGAPELAGMIGLSGPYNFTPRPDLKVIFEGSPPSRWSPIELVDNPNVPLLLIHGRLDYIVQYRNSVTLARAVNLAGGTAQVHISPFFDHFGILLPFFLPKFLSRTQKRLLSFVQNTCA